MSGFHVSARDISKIYQLEGRSAGAVRAIDRVSFEIAEGERVGIVGRNGAGKTTLLQMLAGIASPSEGTLQIEGEVTAIFTLGSGIRDDLPGIENIFIDGELHGKSRAQTRKLVPEIVAFAELDNAIHRPVRTYSTGMKARLAFSMIVHMEPQILIIDEALSVGDAKFSEKATRKMRDLAERGRILIVVSHSMKSIREMCGRCLWIDNGRLRMDAESDVVTKAYLDEVRAADGADLTQRFRNAVVHESSADHDIEAVELLREFGGPSWATLQTNEPAFVRVRLRLPPHARARLRVRVSRLDGLVIHEDHGAELSAWEGGPSGAVCGIGRFGRLPLNYGVYSLQADLLSDDGVSLAKRSTVFEVINPSPHRGGRPVLVTPVAVRFERDTVGGSDRARV